MVKATVNTYHNISNKQLAGLQAPTKHPKEDIQTKRVEKDRVQYGKKKAYACGISKIDLREL